jgi:hypothetical protein
MIRTKMRKYNSSVMVAVYGTPCAIPPRNIKSTNRRVHGVVKMLSFYAPVLYSRDPHINLKVSQTSCIYVATRHNDFGVLI